MGKRSKLTIRDYPELLSEWDYSLNEQSPDSFSSGSKKKVHWICSKGHRWVDSVVHRTAEQRKCPYCNNSKVWPGFNDLESQRPNLLKEWDYGKNDVSPDELFYRSSRKKVWWICPKCKGSYAMSPSDRERGQNCPYCAGKRIKVGFNDLESQFPLIAKEWNYEKNVNILPSQVFAHSNKSRWWICPKGHEYRMIVNNRTGKRQLNCPLCSGKIVIKGTNDLFATNPELKDVWDYSKNKIDPTNVSAGSNKYAYWTCEKGHSYKARIYNMTHSRKGHNCPVCRNFAVSKGINDLVTTHPDLIKEWDFEKNKLKPDEVHAGMQEKKVWWKCRDCGHLWQATIYSRAVQKTGCPECLKEYQTSLPEKTIAFYLSKQFSDLQENIKLKELGRRELDIFIPSLKLAIEYDGHVWHKDTKMDLKKDEICKTLGINLIRIRENGCPKYESTCYFIDSPQIHGNIALLKDTVNVLFDLINDLYGLSLIHIDSIDGDSDIIHDKFHTYHRNKKK